MKPHVARYIMIAAATLPLLSLSGRASGAPGRKAVPPGSYINSSVVSVADLEHQVRTRPDVMARFQRVWHTNSAGVLKRIHELRLGKTESDQILQIFYYRQAVNAWGYKVRRVKKGTPVFFSPDGRPQMLQVCANPVNMLPETLETPKTVRAWVPNETPEGMEYVGFGEEGLEWAPGVLSAPDSIATVAPDSVIAAVPSIPTQTLDTITDSGGISIPAGGGGFSFGNALVPLGIATGGLIAAGGGGNNGGNGGGGNGGGGSNITPPVVTDAPEPGSLLLLAAGLPVLGGVAALRRRRQNRN